MHIELDERDVSYSTLAGPFGTHRALIVRVAGKPFFTMRSVEDWREKMDPDYAAHIDKVLIQSMARILTKVFEKACLDVPEGVELITPEEDELITAKANDAMNDWRRERKVS